MHHELWQRSPKLEEQDRWDPRVHVVSFCTMIAMSVYGSEHGPFFPTSDELPSTGRELRPPELEITKLDGW